MTIFHRPNQARRSRQTQMNFRVTDKTKAQLEALSESLDRTMTDALERVIEAFANVASHSPPRSSFYVFWVPAETKAQFDALFRARGMSRKDVFVQAIAAFAKANVACEPHLSG